MMSKLGLCAERKWRKLRGFNYLAKVINGVEFKDGIEGHAGSSCAKSHHDTSKCTNYPLNTASSRQFALGFRTPDLTDAIEFPILHNEERRLNWPKPPRLRPLE